MSDNSFEIAGRKYKIHKIDVFKQFHIARRMTPIMGEIIAIAPKVQKVMVSSEDASESEKLDMVAQVAKPVMDGFAKLSDADADFILLGLCSAIEIHQAETNNWARVAKDGVLLFNMLDLPTLLHIAGRSFMYNLSGFINTTQQTSHGGK